MSGLSAQEIQVFIDGLQVESGHHSCLKVEEVSESQARVRLSVNDSHLRMGDTVSGPTLMRLVDSAVYIALLGALGPVYDAVTTNLNINFLRRPKPADLMIEIELLKLGQKLAFAGFKIFSVGDTRAVAHGTCTYALPNKSKVV